MQRANRVVAGALWLGLAASGVVSSLSAQEDESGNAGFVPWLVEESALPIYPSRASASGAPGLCGPGIYGGR